jgi:hypothetical protein
MLLFVLSANLLLGLECNTFPFSTARVPRRASHVPCALEKMTYQSHCRIKGPSWKGERTPRPT